MDGRRSPFFFARFFARFFLNLTTSNQFISIALAAIGWRIRRKSQP